MPLFDNDKNDECDQRQRSDDKQVDGEYPAFRKIEASQESKTSQTNKNTRNYRIKQIFRRDRRKPDDERHAVSDRDRFRRTADQNPERDHAAHCFADDNSRKRIFRAELIRRVNR